MTEKKKGLFKKTGLYFKTRSQLIKIMTDLDEKIHRLEQITDEKILKKIDRINVLEQNKVYYIEMNKEDNIQECNNLRVVLERLGQSIQWTLPKILILNRKIKEIPKKELVKLLKKR